MTLDEFVARRRAGWQEFEGLLVHLQRGRIRDLSTEQLERFGLLYRHVASDLALARRDFAGESVCAYLNNLCTRAHPMLRRGTRPSLGGLATFYSRTLPRTFRAAWRPMLLSLAILLLGVLAGWLAVMLRPDLRAALVPTSLFDELARGNVKDVPNPAGGSVMILLNNILVAAICFLGGLILALPTAYALWTNGFQLGTLGAAVHLGGYDSAFWPYIVPHGIVEISVIVMSGGAGFMVAGALARPGTRPRAEVLPDTAIRAVTFTLGVAALLIVCGVIEGFVSPSHLPVAAKLGIGAGYAALVATWLLGAGRGGPRRSQPAPAVLTGAS